MSLNWLQLTQIYTKFFSIAIFHKNIFVLILNTLRHFAAFRIFIFMFRKYNFAFYQSVNITTILIVCATYFFTPKASQIHFSVE